MKPVTASLLGLSLLAGTALLGAPVEQPPKPLDDENRITVTFSAETQRFGLALPRVKDPRTQKPKRLTRAEDGMTSNTCVEIEGYQYLFGRESLGAGVRWARQKGNIIKGVKDGDRKWASAMDYEGDRIRITRTVEIVVGEKTRLYDTVLVQFEVENRDKKPHTVGLREMIHTNIGSTTGVTKVGDAAEEMVDTLKIMEKDKVPPYLQVLESAKLDDKDATTAALGLRLPRAEPPQKVVLCRWPQEFGASEAKWDWRFEAINKDADKGREKDSCAVIYWGKQVMKPGEKRTLAYTYGLGRIN
jgi:hypothetical protein